MKAAVARVQSHWEQYAVMIGVLVSFSSVVGYGGSMLERLSQLSHQLELLRTDMTSIERRVAAVEGAAIRLETRQESISSEVSRLRNTLDAQ